MPALDIFNNDAFSVASLTTAINQQPHQPGRIGQLGLFREEAVATTTVAIEKKNESLSLVPVGPRGSVPNPTGTDKRSLIPFMVPHLPKSGAVYADEIQNLRAFGSESEVETVQNVVNQKLGSMRRDIDATVEHHRIGAMKGQILDADGTTVVLDLFTSFGITKQTHVMSLGTGTTKVRVKALEAKRKSENALGSAVMSGYRAFCSDSFFDAFIDHDNVNKTYEQFMQSEMLRNDPRGGFKFADIIWENYRGKVGSVSFIPDGKALLVPEGVVDLFITFFAPADYVETANTLGLPYYAKQELMRMGKGVELEAQSNPLCMCTRPNAIIELSVS